MKQSRIHCQLQDTNINVIVAQRQEGSIRDDHIRLIGLFHSFKCLCLSFSFCNSSLWANFWLMGPTGNLLQAFEKGFLPQLKEFPKLAPFLC